MCANMRTRNHAHGHMMMTTHDDDARHTRTRDAITRITYRDNTRNDALRVRRIARDMMRDKSHDRDLTRDFYDFACDVERRTRTIDRARHDEIVDDDNNELHFDTFDECDAYVRNRHKHM